MSKKILIVVAGTDLLPSGEPESGQYFSAGQQGSIFPTEKSEDELAQMRRQNNPQGLPVGHHTGRCAYCGSNDLWDDNLAYGCNSCKALLGGN